MSHSQSAQALPPAPLRFNLLVPAAPMNLGPFSFDALTFAIGRPLEDVLRPLLAGPPTRRETQGGHLRVYPLQLIDGVGVAVPLAMLGEFAVKHEAGLLKLTVPAALTGWISTVAFRVYGPVPDAGINGVPVAAAWLRIPAGHCLTIPLEMIGALILEAV